MRWWLVGALVVVMTACLMEAPAPSGDKTTDSVSLKGLAFKPGTVRNAVGVEITFTNKEGSTHNVVWDGIPSGADPSDSDDLSNGDSYSYTPTVAGTYHFHCSHHSGMKGQLIISEAL